MSDLTGFRRLLSRMRVQDVLREELADGGLRLVVYEPRDGSYSIKPAASLDFDSSGRLTSITQGYKE